MPQMAPMWWVTILMMSSMLLTQIMTNLEFDKEKKKKKTKKMKLKKTKILW
uniref:ATP synthase F0 subunit 8 n=1 Tax=Symplanella nigricans TaxID=2886253 RepID=UPI001E6E2D31|nr:ATP synthase F0 subunit 8 [Symplanella nigricans]UDL71983.1 ATP synthase F0 subunit 8 [Symplanella nigricans]